MKKEKQTKKTPQSCNNKTHLTFHLEHNLVIASDDENGALS